MFVKYIEDFLTTEECLSIIELGESSDLIQMKSSLVVNGKVMAENIEYAGNKRMGTYFIDELLILPIIKNLSDKIVNLSNELNPYKGIVYKGVPKYSFNRYGIGDFLDWHPDSHEIANGATITYIVQLNEEYENGEVQYLINNVEHSVPKKKGSVFIFDSNIVHSVKEITKGTRYSINVWPSKEIKKTLL
jgi:Rps23 Pro-64 3,4-dihydroxylase Tpa1-like proline 4-hydroxylase